MSRGSSPRTQRRKPRAIACDSGASMIAGYAGRSGRLDDALCQFARLYADQTEADHHELELAVKRGLLPAEQPSGGTGFRN